MTKKIVKCQSCDGTGRWLSPSIKTVDGRTLPQQSLQCCSCGGAKVLTLAADEVKA